MKKIGIVVQIKTGSFNSVVLEITEKELYTLFKVLDYYNLKHDDVINVDRDVVLLLRDINGYYDLREQNGDPLI